MRTAESAASSAAARLSLRLPVPEEGALRLPAGALPSSDQELLALCAENPGLRIEREAGGEWIVMPPAGGYSGHWGIRVAAQLQNWADRDGSGVAFDSSTGFRLPGSLALRAPDAAWVRRDRLMALTERERRGFLPLCPDFLIEITSASDRRADLDAKMAEYRAAGLPLGWLIVPHSRSVEVWTPAETKAQAAPATVSADPLLPGFVLDLAAIWQPPF